MRNFLKSTLAGLIAIILLCCASAFAQQGYQNNQAPNNTYGQASQQQQQSGGNTCHDCGTVDYIREVEQKGEGTGVGVIGGAVIGGLLGNQIGKGSGRTAATVVGAVGGGYAGNEIEKSSRSTKHYEITVRFDDGNTRVFNEPQLPVLRAGDRVRIYNGQLTRM